MLREIIDLVNENTPYYLEYDFKSKVLLIKTEDGIEIHDYLKIRNALRPWVNDFRVSSRSSTWI